MRAGIPISQADRRARAREATQLMSQACSLGERIACKQVEDHPDEPTERLSGSELCDGARLPRLEQACLSGPASAQRAGCGMATLCHFSGDAGAKNPVKAAQFASRGCAVNDAVSCKILGLQKIEGLGVPKDVEGGLQAILKACHLGDDEACDAIKSLSQP
jgi:TPR repeat protein